MKGIQSVGFAFLSALLAVAPARGVTAAPRPGQTAQTDVVAAVKRELARNNDLRLLMVSAADGEVTLSGRLPTLWAKMDAVKRTLKVEGVKTVATQIELPRQESDTDLALFLGPAIDRYPRYTMFDYIDARILNGVVTLFGSVTPEGRKAEEIAEEVSKVRGVQEIRNEIVTLPPSQNDDNIRASLFDRIASSDYFDQYATARNPPFRIVVHNGTVTLYGRVQTEIEKRQLESFARFTGGVLKVDNRLQTITKPKS
jgi:osmotically-inducible protein OsmY